AVSRRLNVQTATYRPVRCLLEVRLLESREAPSDSLSALMAALGAPALFDPLFEESSLASVFSPSSPTESADTGLMNSWLAVADQGGFSLSPETTIPEGGAATPSDWSLANDVDDAGPPAEFDLSGAFSFSSTGNTGFSASVISDLGFHVNGEQAIAGTEGPG